MSPAARKLFEAHKPFTETDDASASSQQVHVVGAPETIRNSGSVSGGGGGENSNLDGEKKPLKQLSRDERKNLIDQIMTRHNIEPNPSFSPSPKT